MKRLTARLTSTRFAKQVTREHEKGAGLAVPVSGVNVACPRGNLPGAISPRGNLTGAVPCHPCTESNLERTWFPEIGFRRLVSAVRWRSCCWWVGRKGGLVGNKS